MKIVLLLLSSVVCSTVCQIPKLGKCKPRKSLAAFDTTKVTGTWYEIERTGSISEWWYDCVTAQVEGFIEGTSPITLTGFNRYTKKRDERKQELKLVEGSPNAFTLHEEHELSDGTNSTTTPPTPAHQILATDNSNWLLLWSCQDLGQSHVLHTENIWIFARQKTLSEEAARSVQAALDSFNIKHNLLFTTNQNCKY